MPTKPNHHPPAVKRRATRHCQLPGRPRNQGRRGPVWLHHRQIEAGKALYDKALVAVNAQKSGKGGQKDGHRRSESRPRKRRAMPIRRRPKWPAPRWTRTASPRWG